MANRQIGIGLLALALAISLAGCGGGAATETPANTVPPVVSSGTGGDVVAEAVLVPARWSALSFEVPGDVRELAVEAGDPVQEGDVLIRLETEDLARAVDQADVSLRQAQVRLDQMEDLPDEGDVADAQAAVSDAVAAYEQAQLSLTITEHSVSVGDAVRAARAARDEAQRIYQSMLDDGNVGETALTNAENAYLDALGAYNRAVERAQLDLMVAEDEVTRAYHALEQARRALEDVEEGADEQEIELAQLEVEAAGLAMEEAQSRLEEATLKAPFDGVVTEVAVEEGDAVGAGQAVITLATLDQMEARTKDLRELDVVDVEEGQQAVVTVDALGEGTELTGTVTEIALQAEDYRGDVVYTVVVALEDVADLPVRWGMTALVRIDTD